MSLTVPSIVVVPKLTIGGTVLPSTKLANLLDARIELVINGVSEATLRFFDADFALVDDSTFDIAKEIEIALGGTTVFKGEIVAIGLEQGPSDLFEFVVTCLDKGHRLARSTEAKTYQDVSYSDVASTIAGSHGLRAEVASSFGTVIHPYLLQTTDDAAFLSELVRRTGHQWRVDDGKLQVFDGTEAGPITELIWGGDIANLRRFRARLNGGPALDTVTTRAWDPLTKREIVGRASEPGTTALNDSSGRDGAKSSGASMGGAAKRAGTRAVFTSQDEAVGVATALRKQIAASLLQARGECEGDPRLVPGVKVSIAGVGTRLAGEYFLTAVEHVYTRDRYTTRFTAGPITASGLADVLGGAAAPTTHLAPVIGIVTNNKDTQTGREGVVKVKFPTFGDNIESAWARLVSLGAGATRGLQMMPAVNDEVLVVFEGGDYRRPLVIGGLWNGQDTPKLTAQDTTDSGKVVKWGVTTAKGLELLFDDSNDQSLNVLVTADGQATKLYLGKDKVELFSNKKTIEVKSGQADVLLDGQSGDVTIKGMNVTIQATQALKLSGTQSAELKSSAQVSVSAPVAEIKGSTKTDVGGTGITSVAGTPVKIN